MKVTESLVKKVRIEELQEERLDPIEVIIENYENGRGKLIVTSSGKSWVGQWNAMGGSVESFIQRVDNDYLIGCMGRAPKFIEDKDEDPVFIKKMILKQRRADSITKGQARWAWDYTETFAPDRDHILHGVPFALQPLRELEEPWYLDWPTKINTEYTHQSEILDVVRKVIKPN
ncbi:hypothetical protein [Escherichia phage vB_EcoM-LTH01]